MSQTSAKKTTKKQKKPIRRAQRWGCAVPGAARRIIPMLILIRVLGFMLPDVQVISAYWVRAAIGAALACCMALLLYSEGLNSGVADISASRTCAQAIKDGRTLSEKEDASCYHPLKALATVIVFFGIPLVLAIVVALNAREYTYTLQSLPSWLTGTYGTRSDVMAPLAAYEQTGGMVIMDWLRLFVRLFILPMINLFEDPQKMTAMIDRLSPLMLLLLPAAYMVGYLLSPRRADKIDKLNRRAKKVAVRRAERRKVGPELLGAQNQVHYGHKKEEKARKKKELI